MELVNAYNILGVPELIRHFELELTRVAYSGVRVQDLLQPSRSGSRRGLVYKFDISCFPVLAGKWKGAT